MGYLPMTNRLILAFLKGFLVLKLVPALSSLCYGLATFGGVREPSDPVLGLLRRFLVKFGVEKPYLQS